MNYEWIAAMDDSVRDTPDTWAKTSQPIAASSVAAWIAIAAPAALSVVGCFAVAPLMYQFGPHESGALLVFACLGVIQAFAVLVTIMGALGPGGSLTRSLAALTLAFVCFAAWTAGYVWAAGGIQVRDQVQSEVLTLLCAMPFYCFVLGSPLWFLRIVFGWRLAIVKPGLAIGREPITIRGWMTAIAMFSFVLALGRHTVYFYEQTGFPERISVVGAIGTAILTGIGLVNAVPAVFTFLFWKHVRWAVVAFWLYAVVVTATFLLVSKLVWGMPIQAWEILIALVLLGVWAGTQTVFLLGCRGVGFRLVRATRADRTCRPGGTSERAAPASAERKADLPSGRGHHRAHFAFTKK
jgi:hypothetical protein